MYRSDTNRVILLGHIGKDPVCRFGADQRLVVVQADLATNEPWLNTATGNSEKRTEWHRLVCYGKVAQAAQTEFKKGERAEILGRLQTRKYKNKITNADAYITEVCVLEFKIVVRALAPTPQVSATPMALAPA